MNLSVVIDYENDVRPVFYNSFIERAFLYILFDAHALIYMPLDTCHFHFFQVAVQG